MNVPSATEQSEAPQAESSTPLASNPTGPLLTPAPLAFRGADGLREELAVVGYAKVIATLKREPARASFMGLHARISPASVSNTQATEAALATHFVLPGELPAASLALSARGSAVQPLARTSSTASRRVRVYPKLGLAVGYVDATGLASLAADGQVEKVTKAPEVSLIRPWASRAAKLGTQTSWGVKRLKVDQLWAAGYKGKGVVVGHLDTGVDGSHPALKDAIAAFAEFDMSADQVPDAKPRDSGTHGTHTAGTIAGRSGTKGAFGVAPEARLASAMVIEGGQVIDRILAGMEWLVDQGPAWRQVGETGECRTPSERSSCSRAMHLRSKPSRHPPPPHAGPLRVSVAPRPKKSVKRRALGGKRHGKGQPPRPNGRCAGSPLASAVAPSSCRAFAFDKKHRHPDRSRA